MAINTLWNFPGRRGSNHVTLNTIQETEIIPGYIAADGSAIGADLYSFRITNTSGSDCNVTIRDAFAGKIRDVIAVKAGTTVPWSVRADDAQEQVAGNTQWTAQCSAAVANIEITPLFVRNS